MNDVQIKALELLKSIRKNMEKFLEISKELLEPDISFKPSPELSRYIDKVNAESLAIEKAQKEQMVKI